MRCRARLVPPHTPNCRVAPFAGASGPIPRFSGIRGHSTDRVGGLLTIRRRTALEQPAGTACASPHDRQRQIRQDAPRQVAHHLGA